MSHGTRARSESDLYHVVIRGVGRQIIFEDDADRLRFMDDLARRCKEHGVRILAWCLMSNHVHLLLMAPIETVSATMQHVESEYAQYFNRRHDRTGTLFQGRFTSVAIQDDAQLLNTVRYIHLNPVKAGGVLDGAWSSYSEYVDTRRKTYTSTSLLLAVFGTAEEFVRFHTLDEDGHVPLPRPRLTESQARQIAREVLGDIGPYEIRALEKPKRDALIVRMRRAGLSARQISRITSIGQNIIYRAR